MPFGIASQILFKMQSFAMMPTRYPDRQVYARVWKTEKTGHKMPFFINLRKQAQVISTM